ncbi:nuclear transport factor 2 family protein [Nocardia miyunensis]|uniref:nuclear transport factor 2 family protein n=1 Tax=Nocardia miyunensis TaxID=282684 RepID=UPI0008312E56|nr:nuclear transport factor 2 family protein [Nocardia miyunensis]
MSTIKLSTQAEIILDYYTAVDAKDIPAVLARFASTAVYRRPGYPVFEGLTAIEEFYRNERVVGEGNHVVETILESDDHVATQGHFDGFFLDGAPLQLRFADFWKFAEGKVVERNSYIQLNTGRLM